MRVTWLWFLVVVVVSISNLVAAQKPPQRDQQALSLLAQCGAAMGAVSISDTYATGTMATADPNAPAVPITTQTKGAAERFDFSYSDGVQTQALNGGNSWSVRAGKQAKVPHSLSAYHHPEHVPALACVLDNGKSNMSLIYVGQEMLKGTPVHHIRIFLPSSGNDNDNTESVISELGIFLDTQTLVVLKTERYVFDAEAYQNHSVWATYYSDYRVAGSALMPFHIENYLDSHKVRDVVFSSVQVNVGVADAQFQNPNGSR